MVITKESTLTCDTFNCSTVREWVKGQKLPFLAVPEFIASGSHQHDGMEYRFMVMQRFGTDIEKLFTAAGRRFGVKTVCYLALRLVIKGQRISVSML